MSMEELPWPVKWSYSMRPFARPTGHVESMSDWVTARRFHESEGVEDWRVVGEGACAHFRTRSFAAGGPLVKGNNRAARPPGPPPDHYHTHQRRDRRPGLGAP